MKAFQYRGYTVEHVNDGVRVTKNGGESMMFWSEIDALNYLDTESRKD